MALPRYNRDIQILRGIAILAVYVFHVSPHLARSGFLGVDIFFVVSGYLMYALYGGAARVGVRDFLFRRGRRILPAYFVTVAVTTIAVAVLTLPHELAEHTRHALYAAALMPNVGFWMDNSYFEKASLRPLLHLWSLGVELQFYLVFPLAVWLHRKFPLTVAAATAASLAACLAMTALSPKTSFFMTPLRFWEFMAGFYAAAALGSPRVAAAVLGKPWAGLLCLAALLPMQALPLTEFQHPGAAAIAVTAATAGVIVFGLPAAVSAGIAGRALVRLGDYSYSVYLVHFPAIILWAYRPFGGNDVSRLGAADIAAVTALTAVLAILMFRLVETPSRRIASPGGYWRAQALIAAAAVAAVALALPAARQLFDERRLAILDAWSDRAVYRCGKLARIVEPRSQSCDISPSAVAAKPGGPRIAILVGDSHADAIKTVLAERAAQHGIRLRLMKQNYAIGAGGVTAEAVAREAAAHRARAIVLHSAPSNVHPAEIAALARIGAREGFAVDLVEPVPVWPGNVMEALYRAATGGPPAPRQDTQAYLAANAQALDAIGRIDSPSFRSHPVHRQFCASDCALSDGGRPLYFDDSHLTLTGALRLSPVADRIFSAIR